MIDTRIKILYLRQTPDARFVYYRLISDARNKICLKAKQSMKLKGIEDQKFLKVLPTTAKVIHNFWGRRICFYHFIHFLQMIIHVHHSCWMYIILVFGCFFFSFLVFHNNTLIFMKCIPDGDSRHISVSDVPEKYKSPKATCLFKSVVYFSSIVRWWNLMVFTLIWCIAYI